MSNAPLFQACPQIILSALSLHYITTMANLITFTVVWNGHKERQSMDATTSMADLGRAIEARTNIPLYAQKLIVAGKLYHPTTAHHSELSIGILANKLVRLVGHSRAEHKQARRQERHRLNDDAERAQLQSQWAASLNAWEPDHLRVRARVLALVAASSPEGDSNHQRVATTTDRLGHRFGTLVIDNTVGPPDVGYRLRRIIGTGAMPDRPGSTCSSEGAGHTKYECELCQTWFIANWHWFLVSFYCRELGAWTAWVNSRGVSTRSATRIRELCSVLDALASERQRPVDVFGVGPTHHGVSKLLTAIDEELDGAPEGVVANDDQEGFWGDRDSMQCLLEITMERQMGFNQSPTSSEENGSDEEDISPQEAHSSDQPID